MKLKKLLLVALAAIMCLSLTACNSGVDFGGNFSKEATPEEVSAMLASVTTDDLEENTELSGLYVDAEINMMLPAELGISTRVDMDYEAYMTVGSDPKMSMSMSGSTEISGISASVDGNMYFVNDGYLYMDLTTTGSGAGASINTSAKTKVKLLNFDNIYDKVIEEMGVDVSEFTGLLKKTVEELKAMGVKVFIDGKEANAKIKFEGKGLLLDDSTYSVIFVIENGAVIGYKIELTAGENNNMKIESGKYTGKVKVPNNFNDYTEGLSF